MTAKAISHLPAIAVATLAHALWRATVQTIIYVVKAPVRSLVLSALTLGTAIALSNALFMQVGPHPAPLFADKPIHTASVTPAPAIVRPVKVVRVPSVDIPAKLKIERSPSPKLNQPATPVGNADVFAVQKKLLAMGLFEGAPDGYYGPQTANAIRKFEKQTGLEPIGALNAEIVKLIANAKTKRPPKPAVDVPVTPAASIKPTANQSIPGPLTTDPLVKIADSVANAGTKIVTAPSRNTELVKKVQRGLTSLGFLHGKIDGVAGEATAKAIRHFEVFNNFTITGTITAELVDMLAGAGAKV